MKRIYLIRHGECDSLGTYVGRGTDLNLNAEGRQCTATLGDTLKKEGIRPAKIITSTLNRARESGIILSEKLDPTSPLLEDSRLNEIDFGAWEGKTFKDICRDFPEKSQKWVQDNWTTSPPGGENSRIFSERVTAFYKEFLSSLREEEGEILIVGHGGSLRMLLCLFMRISPKNQWQFRLDRSGVAGLEFCGDMPVLFRLN